MNRVLKLKRDSIQDSWQILYLSYEDQYGLAEYANTEEYIFNTHSSIPANLLDISEEFYLKLYPGLCDIWYAQSVKIRPIEYWIHNYVRYGVVINLTFYEYYKKCIQLYNNLNIDSNILIEQIIYDDKWQIKKQKQ